MKGSINEEETRRKCKDFQFALSTSYEILQYFLISTGVPCKEY